METKVRNIRTLKAMANRGLITLHPQTGTKIFGLYGGKSFTCYYVDDAPSRFIYKGATYGAKYFPGCFFPYIIFIN